MNASIIIMTTVLLITIFSPFGVYYGIRIARKKDFRSHRRTQNIIFLICVLGVFALEGLIRWAGGSGSIASKSNYYKTNFFKITLFSHIIVAVFTYLLWAALIVISNIVFLKSLPGKFSKYHRKSGYVIFGGLVYTAITALMVYLMSLNIV